MFYLNIGYRWKLATTIDRVSAGIFLPTGNSSERLVRTPFPEFQRLLIDPQLYLAELDASKCGKVCARLASFPWFGVKNLPEFVSSEMKRRDWDKEMRKAVGEHWPCSAPADEEDVYFACSSALEFQVSAGCTHVILPSPLITEREDEADVQAMWLDKGIDATEELEVAQPLLATVAVSETVLNDDAFSDAGFLDTIVDQVTARDGIDGVYIVVCQASNEHPFEFPNAVPRAYAHLCQRFAKTALRHHLAKLRRHLWRS